jgi:hypothetical protein
MPPGIVAGSRSPTQDRRASRWSGRPRQRRRLASRCLTSSNESWGFRKFQVSPASAPRTGRMPASPMVASVWPNPASDRDPTFSLLVPSCPAPHASSLWLLASLCFLSWCYHGAPTKASCSVRKRQYNFKLNFGTVYDSTVKHACFLVPDYMFLTTYRFDSHKLALGCFIVAYYLLDTDCFLLICFYFE